MNYEQPWQVSLRDMQALEEEIENKLKNISSSVQFIVKPADESLFHGDSTKYNRYVWNYRIQKAIDYINYYQENNYDGRFERESKDHFGGYLRMIKGKKKD